MPLLVDGQRHHRRAVLLDQRHHPGVAGGGAVAVLEVHRVHHSAPAHQLQAGLDHVRFGGVDHQRQSGGAGQAGDHFVGVANPVPADVVDAHVQQVRTVPGLRPRDLGALVPVLGEHGLPERLGAVGVGALPDRQERGVLVEVGVRVQAGHPVGGLGGARGDRLAVHGLHDGAQVLRSGAAAAPHQRQAELGRELGVRGGQLGGGERILGTVLAEHRQPGVRLAGHRDARVLGQVAQVLAHLGRAGGTVQPDRIDAQGLQHGQGRTDLRTHQHGAGGLHGHLGDDRDVDGGAFPGDLGRVDRRFRLQQVLAGLDQDRVRAAADQTLRLVGEAGFQVGVGHVPEAGQLGARSHRTEHPSRPVRGTVLVRAPPRDRGTGLGELGDALDDVVVAEVGGVRTEGVRLHTVHTHSEVGVVDALDHVRAGDVEDLVAALEVLEVRQSEVGGLQHGAHRTVGDHHPLSEGIEQGGGTVWAHRTECKESGTPPGCHLGCGTVPTPIACLTGCRPGAALVLHGGPRSRRRIAAAPLA